MFPFKDKSGIDHYFSDQIILNLDQDHTVIEREEIEKIKAEHDLTRNDMTTSLQICKLLQAHIMITGNISKRKDQEHVIVRAFNVNNSEILGGSQH